MSVVLTTAEINILWRERKAQQDYIYVCEDGFIYKGLKDGTLIKVPNTNLDDWNKQKKINTTVPSVSKTVSKGAVLNLNNLLSNIDVPGPLDIPEDSWVSVAQNIETEHPYIINSNASWIIEAEGATHYRLHFAKLVLEHKFDTLKIINDVTNELLAEFDGYEEKGMWTEDYEAPRLRLEFVSDDTVNRWGFQIDQFQYTTFNTNPTTL
jgi:hypothetical protein